MRRPMAGGSPFEIRPYRASDLDAIYRVCLLTGASGQDASELYKDHKLVGHMFAGGYGVLRPESALVVEDAEGVGGYIIGAPDTPAFEAELERAWWPALRAQYANPEGRYRDLTPDQRLMRGFHHPQLTPPTITDPYPAHLHIDLLPRFQGRGLGKTLIDQWLALMRGVGAKGVHLGVGGANTRAVRFYRAYGFDELDVGLGALVFAKAL
jgi:ribosomal protein S18 acetylase RimI-like enzyme